MRDRELNTIFYFDEPFSDVVREITCTKPPASRRSSSEKMDLIHWRLSRFDMGICKGEMVAKSENHFELPLKHAVMHRACLADVARLKLCFELVSGPQMTDAKGYGLRFHLFVLFTRDWRYLPAKVLRDLPSLIQLPDGASPYSCIYNTVRLLENRYLHKGPRITSVERDTFQDMIFLPFHPLPHLMLDPADDSLSTIDLFKATDFTIPEPISGVNGKNPRNRSHCLARTHIARLCNLFLTNWSKYLLGPEDTLAFSEFGEHGSWRYDERGLFRRWLDIPREVHRLARYLEEPELALSHLYDGQTEHANGAWIDAYDRLLQQYPATSDYNQQCNKAYDAESLDHFPDNLLHRRALPDTTADDPVSSEDEDEVYGESCGESDNEERKSDTDS